MTYASRRDSNEREIVNFWRRVGCDWIPQSREAGFDGLLFAPNGMHIVEIKHPDTRNDLTPRERTTKKNVEFHGDKYNIITTLAEAAALIGMEI